MESVLITSVPCCCSFGLSTKELRLTPPPTSEGQQRTKSGIKMIP